MNEDSRQNDSSLVPSGEQEESYVAARAALLLMAAAAEGCSDIRWTRRVTVESGPSRAIDLAARDLAAVPKPIQCQAKCSPEGLAVTYSAIAEPRFLQAHATQVGMLERGEGVIGSLVIELTDEAHTVSLKGAGEVLELSTSDLQRLEREYLVTMPLTLSKKRVEMQGHRLGGWVVIAGHARPVPASEIEDWLNRQREPLE